MKMKMGSLILVLIISALPVFSSAQDTTSDEEWYKKNFPEEWVSLGTSKKGVSMYYNKASILRAGDYLNVQTRILLDPPQQIIKDDPVKIKYIQEIMAIHCADNTHKITVYSLWADNGEQVVSKGSSMELEPFDADAGHFLAIMAQQVCNQDN